MIALAARLALTPKVPEQIVTVVHVPHSPARSKGWRGVPTLAILCATCVLAWSAHGAEPSSRGRDSSASEGDATDLRSAEIPDHRRRNQRTADQSTAVERRATHAKRPPAAGSAVRQAHHVQEETANLHDEQEQANVKQPREPRKLDALNLPRRGTRPAEAGNDHSARLARGAGTLKTRSAWTVFASLALVLGLVAVCAWILRRSMPKLSAPLPTDVVEVLGRSPLMARQQMQLVRFGNKLLLVSVSPTGAETLSEITDPLEVDRLAGICRESHPQSATSAFKQILRQFSREKPAPGFVDADQALTFHASPAERDSDV